MSENKKTWRNQSKFPNLEKKFTLPRRQEFLDTEYVNGVINDKGELVMRKLTQSERDWLNQFYKETLNTNFSGFESFYPVNGVEKITQKERKDIRKHFLNADKSINRDALQDAILIEKLANQYKLTDETIFNLVKRKEVFDANNALNFDLFKLGLRTTCEHHSNEDLEDLYYPMGHLAHYDSDIEVAMNEYLDYMHRKKMSWPDSDY